MSPVNPSGRSDTDQKTTKLGLLLRGNEEDRASFAVEHYLEGLPEE